MHGDPRPSQSLDGEVITPEDARYDEARALQLDDRARPAAIVYCTTVDDVRAC